MIEEAKCPKCGGGMHKGAMKYMVNSGSMSGFGGNLELPTGGFQNTMLTETRDFIWEEKTGRKIGFIIKRDEKRQMSLEGLRCSLCGFVELYTKT
jgi:hypothetical protein